MARLNNIKPIKAIKFLEKHGWEFANRKGTHIVFIKLVDGKDKFVSVIDNNKTIYWKNVKEMIKKSDIPEKEWIKGCR